MLRRLGWREDALAPATRATSSNVLQYAPLVDALDGRELGTWTIGADSIDLLRRFIEVERPRTVLEFGSGVSTVCLAFFMAELVPEGRLISIEQSEDELERTRQLVDQTPTHVPVHMLHAPLEQRSTDGMSVSTYGIDPVDLRHVLDGASVDMVFIDGPAAESGARFATYPLVRELVRSGALVLMDDAFRDGELGAAQRWKRYGWLRIDGVIPVDHGFLQARAV